MADVWGVGLVAGTSVAAAIGVVLAAFAWRRRSRAGAIPFAVMMLANACWTVLYGLALVVGDPGTTRLLFRVSEAVLATVPVTWLWFAAAYAGWSRQWVGRTVAVAALPTLVGAVFALTDGSHGLAFAAIDVVAVAGLTVPDPTYSPFGLLSAGVGMSIVAAGFVVLVRLLATTGRYHRRQLLLVVVAALLPAVTKALSLLGVAPRSAVDLTPLAVAVEGLVLFGALFGYRLLDLVPVARAALFETLGSPVYVVDGDGRIADVNPAATALADVEPTVGRELSAVAPFLAGVGDGATVSVDGRVFDVERRPLPSPVGSVAAGHLVVLDDVTDRHRRETTLEGLQAAGAEMMTATSVGGVSEAAVDAARDVLGYDCAAVYLVEDNVLRPVAYTDAVAALYDPLPEFQLFDGLFGQAVLYGEPLAVADLAASEAVRDGDPPLASALVVPMGDRGVLWVGTTDPTTFSEAEVDFAELLAATTASSLDRAEREAELAGQNDRLEEFARVVSHDLRNPLAIAKGNVELTMDTGETEHLETVDDALDRIDALVDNLLTQLTATDDGETRSSVSVSAVAREAWGTTVTGGAELVVTGDVEVIAERSRLRQLFENLFRNAIEHGNAGTVTVGEVDGGFFVEDDGRGIPPEIDDPFERGVSGDDGTGIGLSVVRSVAEDHGWTPRVAYGNNGHGAAVASPRGDDDGSRDGEGDPDRDRRGDVGRGARFEFVP